MVENFVAGTVLAGNPRALTMVLAGKSLCHCEILYVYVPRWYDVAVLSYKMLLLLFVALPPVHTTIIKGTLILSYYVVCCCDVVML